MARVKVKKHSTFIDMTAMSDVTVLLLTFFMLTSTFVKSEPVQVTIPSSVSEIKIPESNVMTILVDPNGKIFMSLDNKNDMEATLRDVGKDYGITFTDKQLTTFQKLKSFGIPIRVMASFLNLSTENQDKYMRDLTSVRVGIPMDSVAVSDNNGLISNDNEFRRWVSYATTHNAQLQIAIKCDKDTNYPIVKRVMDDLRDMRKNRYLLITTLKTASNE
jgi:biopolymer transport protein ExbD